MLGDEIPANSGAEGEPEPPEGAQEWDEQEAEIVVPVSAIEHYSYCPRQCALIHVEQTFEENLFTVRGKLEHERVDSGADAPIRGVRVVRSLPLHSARLGLRGKADLVELRPEGPYPVEYKSGRRHGVHADLQLCAQALCLEEMMGVAVARGAIFYAGVRRRHEVVTGVAVINSETGSRYVTIVTTAVCMRDYGDHEIAAYISQGEPFDKAGSYAIQSESFHPVARIEGCYLNVVGLPACELIQGLRLIAPWIKWTRSTELDEVCRGCSISQIAGSSPCRLRAL